MSYSLPDGSKLFLGITFGSPITVSAVTNADPANATATAHGQTLGTVFIFNSGWEDADGRVFRVANPTTNNFDVEGLDASSTSLYSAGTGTGTIVPVTAWQEIQQVLNPTTSGGEQQYVTVSPLARRNDIQIPSNISAMSMSIPIGDDPTLAGYQAVKLAADNRELRPLKILKPNGNVTYFYGYVGFNEVASFSKGQVDTVTASFAMQGLPTKYTS